MSVVARTEKALAALRQLGSGIDDGGKVIGQLVAEELEAESKAAFREQADPVTAKPWARRAGNRDPQRAILFQWGKLKGGINAKARLKTKTRVLVEGAVIGSAHKYALKHQEGTDNLPQRRFMGLSDEDWDRVEKRYRKAMQKRLVG